MANNQSGKKRKRRPRTRPKICVQGDQFEYAERVATKKGRHSGANRERGKKPAKGIAKA